MVYPWQKQVWQNLTTRFPDIGHGLLFYGKTGCGKQDFSQQFVAWVLCQRRHEQNLACGECGSCQWLKADTHPNYVYVSVDEENKKQNAKIKIEKIRDLLPFVQQTVEGWRVIVIQPAEALNTASANALLKTLEEPGEQILIILLAQHYLKLPATIRSRLQHFALDRIQPQQALNYIAQALPDTHPQQQYLLMNLANQMPLQAIELASAAWLAKRAEFLADWTELAVKKHMPMAMSSKWHKALPFHEWMQMFEYLLADIICVKLNQSIKNLDLDFSVIAEQYHLETLFEIYTQLQESKKLLEQNVQTHLILDQLAVKMMQM